MATVAANESDDQEPVSRVAGNFNRIARDLDRAIRAARFTEAQRFLLDEARELSWSLAGEGPMDAGDQKPCVVLGSQR